MSKKAKAKTALEVSKLTAEGLHAVGGVAGLYLQITDGARSWILRVTVGDKRRYMGLGGYPDVTLAQAHDKAREARRLIDQGVDPILDRKRRRSDLQAQQAAGKTFAEVQHLFLDAKSDEWRNAKHRAQWGSTLDTYAGPVIGNVLVGDVTQAHVETILTPIWKSKTETATRVRGRIEQVLDYAKTKGWRTGDNPARWRGFLDKTLAKPTKIKKKSQRAALPIDDMPAFMVELRARHGISPRALEFQILTAARPGEVRGALWSEIDLDEATWTVPGERMKAGKAHRVPLSPRAVTLLRSLDRVDGVDVVFMSPSGGTLSDMAMTKVTRDMKVAAVPHGMRSSFKDWASERTAYPNELSEAALAHTIPNKSEAAYRRGDLFDKRRRMMDDWAKFIDTPTPKGKVVPMRGRKSA